MIRENTPAWDDDPSWCPPPPLQGDARCDVVVVGLGASGLTAVQELCRLGIDVIGIDAADIGAGAAGRNGGLLLAGIASFHHDAIAQLGHEQALTLYRRTLVEQERIFDALPECTRRTGSLRLASSAAERADCRIQLHAMQRDGLPVEWYDGLEGEGLLFPTDGVMNPLTRARTLADRAVEHGARLFTGTPALRIAANAVQTPHGTLHCERVIVAVDGRLETVLPELAPRVRTARLQMLATAPAHDVIIPRPIYWRDGFEYWQQLPDGGVALGGFRDTEIDAEWTCDATPTPGIQQRLEQFLREHIGTHAEITHRWAASVAYTHTGLPICEEVRSGVFAIGAYSGTGNIVGVVCAQDAVDWATASR